MSVFLHTKTDEKMCEKQQFQDNWGGGAVFGSGNGGQGQSGHQKHRYFFLGLTQPYLNLLVKPRIFFKFSGKNIILCILSKSIKKIQNKKLCAYPTNVPKMFRPVS